MTKQTKEDKQYKRRLMVAGAMDLYGLDRETAEELCNDVEALLKDQREEIEKKITEFFDEEAWSLAHTDAWENRDKLLAKLKQTK